MAPCTLTRFLGSAVEEDSLLAPARTVKVEDTNRHVLPVAALALGLRS
jgi:hypothetical protein